MKELSIEEKAQRYDDLLVKLQEAKVDNDVCDERYCCVIDDIVPELAESEDDRIRKKIIATIHLYYGEPLEKEAKEMIAWLEKQGEHKPAVIIPKFRVGDEIKTSNEESLTITKIDEKGYWSEDLFICGFDDADNWKLVEQKPADKAEPKFHEGDFIVHHGTENIYQVVAIIDNQYQLKYGDTYTVQKCTDVDRCSRLWDITKDAKDGDVLYSPCCKLLWIYKDDNSCYVGNNLSYNKNCVVVNSSICIPSDVCPATKEQRDLLFQKMKEAGYVWDDEKKELKKIERKPTEWNEEDINMIDWLIRCCEKEHEELCNDKYGHQDIVSDLKRDCRKKWDWLESLKNRVAPQKQWKPSDNELEALRLAAEKDGTCLMGLYEQLKKLKG